MRITTDCMRFNNGWIIYSSYYIEVHPGMLPALQGLLSLFTGAHRCTQYLLWYSAVFPNLSHWLPWYFWFSPQWFQELRRPAGMPISKKHFRPGGMAPSEWTRSVRAVRDTPVVDYSTPGVNATRRVAYCPLNAVSPFLLALSVS